MIPDELERKVRLPVCWDGKQWQLHGGEPLPALRPGAAGELVVSAFDFISKEALATWTTEAKVSFLPVGAKLRAQVRHDDIPKQLVPHRLHDPQPLGPALYVELVLLEELTITVLPGKHATLGSCSCLIPALDKRTGSVNEAYTRISEQFEPGRVSHSGNVFDKVFYETPQGFRKLAERRSEIEGAAERVEIASLKRDAP